MRGSRSKELHEYFPYCKHSPLRVKSWGITEGQQLSHFAEKFVPERNCF